MADLMFRLRQNAVVCCQADGGLAGADTCCGEVVIGGPLRRRGAQRLNATGGECGKRDFGRRSPLTCQADCANAVRPKRTKVRVDPFRITKRFGKTGTVTLSGSSATMRSAVFLPGLLGNILAPLYLSGRTNRRSGPHGWMCDLVKPILTSKVHSHSYNNMEYYNSKIAWEDISYEKA